MALGTAAAGAVREAMRARRVSQHDLATAWGLSQAAVSRRLSGAVAITLDELEKAADLLDVDPIELLEGAA